MQLTNTDFEDYQQLLHLEDCDTYELTQLLREYQIDKGRPEDIFINKLLVRVTVADFDALVNYGRVTPLMMAFLLNALKRISGNKVPLTLGMVNILSAPDADYLEYDSFRENAYLQYTKYDPEEHEFLGLIIYHGVFKRWICTIQQPDYFEGMAVDFAEDKRSSPEKLNADIMQLCQESFNIIMNPESYKILTFDQKSRFKKTDFGAYVFTYLYKFLQSKDVLKTKFLDDELMELGQNRLIWMLLRARMFEKHPEKIDEEFDKLNAKKKRQLEMDDDEIDKMRELEFAKYTDESKLPQFEKFTEKELRKLKKKYNKRGYNQTNILFEKLDVQLLAYDYESVEKANFITPKLMQFLTVYLDVNDKVKLDKGIFFAQVNVLSTPDDDYFEYDLLRIDKDAGGKVNIEKDSYVIILIYYKYKWAFALYDFIDKSATLVDFKMDDNQSFDDTVTDLADIFKVEFNINVDDFSVRPEWQKIKESGDAGSYVVHYLYRWLTSRRLNDIKFDERDKKQFKSKIEWITLKFWEAYEKEEEERLKNEEKAAKEKKKRMEEEEQEKLREQALKEEEELRKQMREQRAGDLRALRDGGHYPPYNFSMQVENKETQTAPYQGNRQLEGSDINEIFSISGQPPELLSRQQTLYNRQHPQYQDTKGILDKIRKVDPNSLRKVPLGVDDLENDELEKVVEQLTHKKPAELELQDKLFDVLEVMNDPERLEELKKKNSNIKGYVDLLKKYFASKKKKKQKPIDKVDFADLWYDQDENKINPRNLQEVIRESMKDNTKHKNRLMDKYKNPTINTSWYYLELTKRNIDPQYQDIIDDVLNQRAIPDTDNKYKAFMMNPSEKTNYLEQLHYHQTPQEFYKNKDTLDKIKEDFNKDLKRGDFLRTDINKEIYQQRLAEKNINRFNDKKSMESAAIINSNLSKSYVNPKLSKEYNTRSLQSLGKSLVSNRYDPTDDVVLKRKHKQKALDYQEGIYNNLSLKQMQKLRDKREGDYGKSKRRMISYKKENQKSNFQSEFFQPYEKLKPQLENPVALRYNIPILNPEILQIFTHDIVTENVFNFFIHYIEEKHRKTTTEKMRHLNYTRIWFVPTEFFKFLSVAEVAEDDVFGKASKYVDLKGNLLEKYDYMFIPVWSGEQQETSLIIVDFLNKALLFYFVRRNEDQYAMSPIEHPYLKLIHQFLIELFRRKYNVNIDKYSWKYKFGSNSRTSFDSQTCYYVLIFATFLTRGNFVFQGVTESLINSFKENMVKILQNIGVNNDGEIEDFNKIPL